MALTNVVVRVVPFQRMTEDDTKLLPLIASVNEGPPAVAAVGESAFATGTAGLIVKVSAAEVPPPGPEVNTVTRAVPAVAMSLAEMAA